MKDWIKVTDSKGSRLIRVADINHVYTNEDGAVVDCGSFATSVKESVDEILQLIEGEKPEKDRLLERLKKLKEECLELGDDNCDSCKSMSLCTALLGDPYNWDIEKIKRELR